MTSEPLTTKTERSSHVWWRFRLRSVFVVMAIASIVFALLHFTLRARRDARRRLVKNNFKMIGIALHTFNANCSRLPRPAHHVGAKSVCGDFHNPQATALFSWRYSIAPFIASYGLSPVWHLPWNAPSNARWRSAPQPYSANGWDDPTSTDTCAFAITGKGTAFGDSKHDPPRSLEEIEYDTILVVEVRKSGVHWMEPGDFDIRNMPKTVNSSDGISGIHKIGFHVLFADATVWCLSYDVPFEDLNKFFTIAGARKYDRAIVLKPYVK